MPLHLSNALSQRNAFKTRSTVSERRQVIHRPVCCLWFFSFAKEVAIPVSLAFRRLGLSLGRRSSSRQSHQHICALVMAVLLVPCVFRAKSDSVSFVLQKTRERKPIFFTPQMEKVISLQRAGKGRI
jgi:hypothetical protein